MKCISSNNKVTKKEIADIAGVSEKTIEREMKKMTNVKFKGHGHTKITFVRENSEKRSLILKTEFSFSSYKLQNNVQLYLIMYMFSV